MSFEIILPFLAPIRHLIEDPEISDIMVNPGPRVFVERHGRPTPVPDVTLSAKSLMAAAKHIARACGSEVSDENPILDARLPDGSRVAIVLPPCSVGGVTMTIRKFGARHYTPEQLVENGMLSLRMHELLLEAIARRENVIISGATGVGKTTLLAALARAFPLHERLIVIEETCELQFTQPNIVRFEARRAQEELKEVTIRDLVRAALRHFPSRLVVGEVRGAEALDMLAVLNTGHSGSLSSIHSNSGALALSRLASCARQAGELDYETICTQIANCIHLVLHLRRTRDGQRHAHELTRLVRYNVREATWEVESLCTHTQEEKLC
jgi:pilus assembly protein CpaF